MLTIRLQTMRYPSGNLSMSPNLESLPESITAPRTDAIYNCHGYLTKVPIAAIRPFIETFSEPDETVADFFAGSGMTGIASLISGRKAVLSDISVLGQHIATGYLAEVSPSALRVAARSVMQQAREQVGDLYKTCRAADNAAVELTRIVWSFTYGCPACGHRIVFYERIMTSGTPSETCTTCGMNFERRKWRRGEDVPVEVVVVGKDGRLTTQAVSDFDREMIATAAADHRQEEIPSLSITQDREMYSRSGLAKVGMTETARFFSPRNAIALLELWRAVNAVSDEHVRRKLRFAFTAILPRASKRYQWSPLRPLNAQNQTYYIAPVYYEWNIFELFERKVEASQRADEELFGGGGQSLFRARTSRDVRYELASANHLHHLERESVDYIFTDPPFGSNIFYSDMSLFHEAWIGSTTDHENEAVVHTTGKRKVGAADRYEKLLRDAFSEAHRVLKDGRYMSVVFGNSSGRIWGLVQRAMRDAGFKAAPVHVAILDKGQRSVKGLNSGSEGVVTVDLILTVKKPDRSETSADARAPENGDTAALIREAIADLSVEKVKNASHVYARVLTKAIQKHLLLDDLHLGDVLVALRKTGYTIDGKTGLLLEAGAGSLAA
jgi:16S rRNA G966 N2-methylase RsmD